MGGCTAERRVGEAWERHVRGMNEELKMMPERSTHGRIS